VPNLDVPVPSLIGGVSQQPPQLRFSSQCAEMVNCFPSVTEGLSKRPPTQHVKSLEAIGAGFVQTHFINRDASERYLLRLKTADAALWTIDGAPIPIYGPTGNSAPDFTYLTSGSAMAFRCLTIADFTFIVNVSKAAAMKNTLTPSDANVGHAFLWARQSAFKAEYILDAADGGGATLAKTVKTWDGTALGAGEVSHKTNKIADDGTVNSFVGGINAMGGAPWTATAFGSVVRVTSASAFTKWNVEDSLGGSGSGLIGFNREIDSFDMLPDICRDGYVVKVRGDSEENTDDFYVKFKAEVAGTLGKGSWQETTKEGIAYQLDPDTMPHQLTRHIDDGLGTITGTPNQIYFRFGPVAWNDRQVGDTVTNPDPSFIGKTINDIFFFRGRLGFLAGQNVILSETSRFFNFFRTSVVQVVDSDPVDVAAQHTTVSTLRHATPFEERLVLWSDRTQFVLSGEPILTPKTASIVPVATFECSTGVRPLSSGKTVFFAGPPASFATISEFFQISDSDTFDAAEATKHVPKYIPGGVGEMAVSTRRGVLAVRSFGTNLGGTGDDKTLWIYTYFWNGQERAQAAWGKFTFESGALEGIDFIDDALYIVLNRQGTRTLEKILFGEGQRDADTDFIVLLDRRIVGDDGTASYNAGTDRTTFELPYDYIPGTEMAVVTGGSSSQEAGVLLPSILDTAVAGDHKISVAGDWRNGSGLKPVWIGQKYEMRFTFSQPTLQENSERGGRAAVTSGRWQLHTGSVSYDRSLYFEIHVTPELCDTSVYLFSGETIGLLPLGIPELSAGEFDFPVMSKNDQVSIEIVSKSHLPCFLTSAEWHGSFTTASTRYRG
jgi:hypothetical protein